MLKKLMITLALTSSLFAMHEAELDLNNYDFNALLNLDMGQFNTSVDPDTVFLGVGYLHASQEHSDHNLPKDENLYNVHFFVQQRLNANRALKLGLGTKLVYTSVSNHDFTALPIGVLADYTLPLGISIPFVFGGSFYYSPRVLSWQDAQNYMEWELHLNINLIDRAALKFSYSQINTDFEGSSGNDVFNQAWYGGIIFRF
jgi:hypothetical protein